MESCVSIAFIVIAHEKSVDLTGCLAGNELILRILGGITFNIFHCVSCK